MPDGERERTIVKCADCSSVYAAERWSDGTIQPIGTRTGCECGSTTFHVVEESNETAFRDERPD